MSAAARTTPVRAVVFAYSDVGDRCLRVLVAAGIDVALVVTHRDRPDEARWFASVAETAAELGLTTTYGDDLHDPELARAIVEAKPDLVFSFYFRSMIPMDLLSHAPLGAFNLHGSMLPRFRGRAPTNWAVLTGATATGATLHEMLERADAGAIVDQLAVPILPDDTGRDVFDKVCVAAEIVLWRSIDALAAGTAPRLPNAIDEGHYFGARRPEDGRIDWSKSASDIYNLIRAVAPPYPGAFCEAAGTRLVVAAARRADARAAPRGLSLGLHAVGERIVAVCGDGGLIDILRLERAGTVLDAAALTDLLATT